MLAVYDTGPTGFGLAREKRIDVRVVAPATARPHLYSLGSQKRDPVAVVIVGLSLQLLDLVPSSRVELEHGVRVAPENLTERIAAPELLLPPDDERLMRSHIEDRDHGAATQRVAPAHLGDAINGSPPRPEADDPA